MTYPVPTLEESEEIAVAAFRSRFPDRHVRARTTYHRRRLQTLAMVLTELHAHVDSAADDTMPDTAIGAFAQRWSKAFGVVRKGATPARKSDALRVRGDVGTAIESGTTLTHLASGLRFQVNEDDVIPAGGEVDVDVVAIDTGSRTRLEAGEVLEFDETPLGLKTQAELQLDLDEGGDDEEQESAFKRRYLKAIAEASAGGNDADYARWMTAMDGIDQAYVYGNRAGRGTIDVVALHAGDAFGAERALTEAEGADVLAALRELAPTQVSATGGSLRHLTVVPDEQDVEVTVEPNGAKEWAFDWDDSTPPVIAAWDPDTRTLTFTADRPSAMKAGDRLCIHGVASEQTGEVLVIEALIGDDGIKLEEAPEVAPVATDVVYAGGPLTAMIRDAILAHLGGDIVYGGDDGPIPGAVADEQHLSVFELRALADGIGPANPGGKYGEWSGGIIRAVIEQMAVYARGCRNATCVVPAADYEAEDIGHAGSSSPFTEDYKIGLVVAGEVLVRRAW